MMPGQGAGQTMQPCTWCGRPMDPLQAVYSKKTGQLVCRTCEAAEMVHDAHSRAGGNIAYGALAAGAAAWLGLCGGILFLIGTGLAVVAIVGGIQSIRVLSRPEYKALPNHSTLFVCSIIALILGSTRALFGLVGLLGLMAMAGR